MRDFGDCQHIYDSGFFVAAVGKLLILDFPYPSKLEDFRNPIYDMGVYDQYYEVIGGFTHLTTAEQTEMLTRICFKDIQRMSIGKGMFEFVTATK